MIDINDRFTGKFDIIKKKRNVNGPIDDSIRSIVKKYLKSNIDSTSSGISSSHIVGALTAKGNLNENPMASFDLIRQQSLDYAMEHTKELIEKGGSTIHGQFKPWLKDADEELRTSISTVITDGINKGKSRDDIKKDLREVYDADDVRIDKIAGWEIPNAQYHGAMDQYAEDGVTIFEWLLGDSPCEICEPYGQKRYFTEDELPPDLLHNHCQCDIAPVAPDQITSMINRIINGGEGSGEHEGHEFRGNQYGSGDGYGKPDNWFFRGKDTIGYSSHNKIREHQSGEPNATKAQAQAIGDYTGSGFASINDYRRNGSISKEALQYGEISEKRAIESAKQLEKSVNSHTLPEGIPLYRGARGEYAKSMLSLKEGDILEDNGFMSFSTRPSVAHDFNHVDTDMPIFRTVTEKGDNGIAIPGGESEVILKGGKWKVIAHHSWRNVNEKGYESNITDHVIDIMRVK